jgi:3-oxoacyl-[acyl-carrier protein] reductase
MDLSNSLKGLSCLVTGASGGIGSAIAKEFHSLGAYIIISGRNEDALHSLKSQLGHSRVYTLPLDLSSKTHLEDLPNTLARGPEVEFGTPVSILVNNAGITKDSLFARIKDDDIEQVLDVNLKSIFKISKACIKSMRKAKFGRIINISSIIGFTGNVGQTLYSATKGAITSFTKSLALEYASSNITVNSIAPGYIETPMTAGLSDDIKNKIIEKIPQKRIGNPEDVAFAAGFLASKKASYITGQTIHVNGGMAMF